MDATAAAPAASADFARRWAGAIGAETDASAVLSLERLTDRLAGALAADPFEARAGCEVGAALVGIRLGSADTIDGTVDCLSDLGEVLGVRRSVQDERLPDLIGAVVTGYAAAVQACADDEAPEE